MKDDSSTGEKNIAKSIFSVRGVTTIATDNLKFSDDLEEEDQDVSSFGTSIVTEPVEEKMVHYAQSEKEDA